MQIIDTTLMAENEEELKSLLMQVKEDNEKAGLKLNIQKAKIMASSSITSWQVEGKKSRNSDTFYFLGLQKIKSDTVSIVSPSICHEVMGPDAMILVF